MATGSTNGLCTAMRRMFTLSKCTDLCFRNKTRCRETAGKKKGHSGTAASGCVGRSSPAQATSNAPRARTCAGLPACCRRATPEPPRTTPGWRCPHAMEVLRDRSSSCRLQLNSAPHQSCIRSWPTPGATSCRLLQANAYVTPMSCLAAFPHLNAA